MSSLTKVAILVANQMTDSGLSIALDVFRTANLLRQRTDGNPLFKIQLASASGAPVNTAAGLRLKPDTRADRLRDADILIVPGFWVKNANEVDAFLSQEDVRRLIRSLKAAHARGAVVGSSCGGAFLLAEAGLLDGKACTTTWWLGSHLKRRRPAVHLTLEESLVVDGRILTAGAVFAQADLALHLVSRIGGPALARECANLLLLDRHASQTPYMAMRYLNAGGDPIAVRSEKWVKNHLAEKFSIPHLAKHLGIGCRTLARRLETALGLSPIAFVQRLRIEEAIRLLETSRLSLEEVSERVGYEPNALRKLIRRETGFTLKSIRRRSSKTPSQKRKRFSTRAERVAPA